MAQLQWRRPAGSIAGHYVTSGSHAPIAGFHVLEADTVLATFDFEDDEIVKAEWHQPVARGMNPYPSLAELRAMVASYAELGDTLDPVADAAV